MIFDSITTYVSDQIGSRYIYFISALFYFTRWNKNCVLNITYNIVCNSEACGIFHFLIININQCVTYILMKWASDILMWTEIGPEDIFNRRIRFQASSLASSLEPDHVSLLHKGRRKVLSIWFSRISVYISIPATRWSIWIDSLLKILLVV